MHIWQQLPKPILSLAPMEDVTDTVFRQIIIQCGGAQQNTNPATPRLHQTTTAFKSSQAFMRRGRPDLMFTEFMSVEGFQSAGQPEVSHRLKFTPKEQPLIAQIWGINPENFYSTAQKLVKLGFVGIDINLGCPQKKIVKTGGCAALINNRPLASKIITATKKGAANLPVSVKTRIGYQQIDLSWIEFLLKQNLTALIIHLRTKKEMSSALAHWDLMPQIIALKDELAPATKIIGNGDITNRAQSLDYCRRYHLDGVMVGRAVLKDPFFFHNQKSIHDLTSQQKVSLYLNHVKLWHKTWGDQKHFAILKKFSRIYLKGFPEATHLRSQIAASQNLPNLKQTLSAYLTTSAT